MPLGDVLCREVVDMTDWGIQIQYKEEISDFGMSDF